MLKKRLIFTLIYKEGFFMQSRNFRLQKIGDFDWILKNYNFSRMSRYIDELCILNVSANPNSHLQFIDTLKNLSQGCFIPITAGGGIRDYAGARDCFNSGADKVILNNALFDNPQLISHIALDYGKQAIVGSLDFTRSATDDLRIYQKINGESYFHNPSEKLHLFNQLSVGEWYLNSINRDGTGQGLDLSIIDEVAEVLDASLIIAGGVGNSNHVAEGLDDRRISAVATANLLNFVGDGLKQARAKLVHEGHHLATWSDFS
jgi:imidazole glycerol-phosphate synthase subunit HisF